MSRPLVLTVLAAVLCAAETTAQQITTTGRLRFRLADPLVFRTPPEFLPGGRFGPPAAPGSVARRWRTGADRVVAQSRAGRWLRFRLQPFQPEGATNVPDPAVPPPGPTELQGLARYADLNLELNARVETRLDRLRNLNCNVADIANPASGCQGGFPTPELAEQFQLRANGVIGDRINVNVDFDGDREFSVNNTINLWYQGREDDIVRRVEVGNLNFQLPASRFITSAIPANSFGIQAEAQLGPLEFRSILAQQKGSSIRTRTFTVGDQATQMVERTGRGGDFEVGRFFFIVNPLDLIGYPALDVLNLEPTVFDASLRPADVRVYRLRAQSGQVGPNANLGGIDAIAQRGDSPQRVGPFPWELLVEGRDYYLDPSGLWFALANRISTEEYLAVSYITAAGDTVGTFPAINGRGDTLRLIHEPRRGTEVPTFPYEMRNFYRIGGGDLSRNSIEVQVLVKDSERPLDGIGTYLSRFDIALATDPARLDEFNRVFPRERDPNGGAPVRDLFLVFPHLEPLSDATRLQPGESNDSLYTTPAYLLATQGPAPVFRFDWVYRTAGSGDRSRLSLGALQIREGSETLVVGGRELVRGRDYEIQYDIGTVTFANPDSLFVGPSEVQVRFEENQLFQDVAPKNVLGLATTYNLGTVGRIDAIGLFQRERTIFTRPRLGFEPQSMFMGGLSTDLDFRLDWMTSALDGLPFFNTGVPSTLELNGEVALSRPNPNQAGEAYIEEFEGESARTISLEERLFQLGSAPLSVQGISPELLGTTGGFDVVDAVPLVWQNGVEVNDGPLEIGAQEIDSTIVLTGTSRQIETLLWLTLKPDTIGGAPHPVTGQPRWFRPHTSGPRWRSLTTPLDRSGLGVDLSRTEFLEFWLLEDFSRAPQRQGVTMVFDFGTVLEDAVAFGPDALRVSGADTTFTGFQLLGEGRLDSEKDPVTNVFNAVVHDVGIHGDRVPQLVNTGTSEIVTDLPMCEQGFTVGIPVFPLGSLNAGCTRRNGRSDSEDLNGDNRLDITTGPAQEDVIRYVVPIGDERFVVRTGRTLTGVAGRTMTWRLYRIPFRDTIEVGAPDIRQIRSLRITMAAPDVMFEEEVPIALARMKLVGAPWLKRAETPIAGLGGITGEPHGEVLASIISTENEDLGYESPPGVRDEAERQGAVFEVGSQQINERSLRLLAADLRQGERAEAFIRFADEGDKNFLKYRTLRVWARGRGPGWLEQDLEFFIKAGADEDNFYLYRTPVRSDSWEPEVVVELDRWLALRAEIEASWLAGDPPSGSERCGGDPAAFVNCDGPYLVQIRDPDVSPPNLARVSEVAVGMIRSMVTVGVGQAELWVDDIRLGEVVDDVGMAGAFDARLRAADIAEIDLSHVRSDDRFRELDQLPDYQGDATTRLASTVQLGKFLPNAWGISMPASVEHTRSSTDPFFVRRSDVRAAELSNLRDPGTSSTQYQVAFRRARRGATLAERILVDPLTINAAHQQADVVTELSDANTVSKRLRVDYNTRPAPKTIRAVPGFVSALVDKLPGFVRNSEFARALRTSRLRLNPQQVHFVSGLTDNTTRRATFRVPVELESDTALVPITSIVHSWRNQVGVDLRPFSSLGLRVDYISTRDLQNYGDSTSVTRLVEDERRTFLGRDVGFERDRALETALSVAPVINSWLRPSVVWTTEYFFRRDPNGRSAVEGEDDGSFRLRVPEAVSNFRRTELGSTVDVPRLASAILGSDHLMARMTRGVLPADVRYNRERRSTFDRVPFQTTLRYQLGFGSIDEFRQQNGILATSAVDLAEWVAAGGAQLPLGFRVRVNYRELDTRIWARRADEQSEITQRSSEWPAGTVSWVYTPGSAVGRIISTVTAQTQYRRTETSSFQPPGVSTSFRTDGVRAESNRETLRPRITLTWAGGIVTTAEYQLLRTDVLTSGNLTRTDRRDWGGTMNFSFRSPSWLARLPNDVRTALSLNSSDESVCLRRADDTSCAPISDSRRSQLDLRMDTGFPPNLRGGASLSYVLTEQRHTSSRFSRLILTVFLDINFLASQIR